MYSTVVLAYPHSHFLRSLSDVNFVAWAHNSIDYITCITARKLLGFNLGAIESELLALNSEFADTTVSAFGMSNQGFQAQCSFSVPSCFIVGSAALTR